MKHQTCPQSFLRSTIVPSATRPPLLVLAGLTKYPLPQRHPIPRTPQSLTNPPHTPPLPLILVAHDRMHNEVSAHVYSSSMSLLSLVLMPSMREIARWRRRGLRHSSRQYSTEPSEFRTESGELCTLSFRARRKHWSLSHTRRSAHRWHSLPLLFRCRLFSHGISCNDHIFALKIFLACFLVKGNSIVRLLLVRMCGDEHRIGEG